MAEETQVSTVWLQCILVFCFAWGVGSMLTADGRRNYGEFYRKAVYGDNKNLPKPKSFKLQKNQLFPDKGTIFDWIYDKKNNGTWISWSDLIDKLVQIPANAKVCSWIRISCDLRILIL